MVLCEPCFPCRLLQSALVYGNVSMLDYMLGTAYGLLCVPLLHILDTDLVHFGVMFGVASTDLLRCQHLGQQAWIGSSLQLRGFNNWQLW